jgi:mannose-6-phosphate isomerase-like protein (cupin superfamily)
LEPNQANYTVSHKGAFANLGKVFLKDALQLTSMEVSLNNLPPNGQVPFYHKHRENEELYVFLKGQGQFHVDGNEFDVFEGTSVRVAPVGVRALRNASASEDLIFIVIQAKENSLAQWVETDGIILERPIEWSIPV